MGDLKHAWRVLWKSPGFTFAAVAALALGIGANTAIFSVVSTVLLKPLPYPDPDRLMTFLTPDFSGESSSVPKFAVFRDQTSAFQDVAAFASSGIGFNLIGDRPEQVPGVRVTEAYFRLFGVPIERGRVFTPEEDSPHGPHVALISDGLWRRRFGSDPGIIGRAIRLGEDSYTVVGIVGPQFYWDPNAPPAIWVPFQFDLQSTDVGNYFMVAGRLRPGVTLQAAKAELKLAVNEYLRRVPSGLEMGGPKHGFSVEPFRDTVVRDARPSLLILSAAVGLVLLIACANVANLLLVRATARKREIAIRAALGAGRGRIVRQLLTESVLLSVLGGAVGLALGFAGLRALLAINPGNIPRISETGAGVGLDWRVLLFTAAVSIGSGILFGLTPALAASRADLNTALKESAGRTGSGFRQNKARSLLVVSEVLLSVVLLIGTALLIRSYMALRSVNPGFDPHNVLTMQITFTGARFEKTAGLAQAIRNGVDHLEVLPGVAAAAVTICDLPSNGGSCDLPVTIPGHSLGKIPFIDVDWQPIAPHYFDVFRIRLLKGRAFTVRDDTHSTPVAIINQTMAKQFWPHSDPLQDRLIIGHGVGPEWEEPARQIVGVVADIHNRTLSLKPRAQVYLPATQMTDGATALISRVGAVTWVIRTAADPSAASAAIQKQLQQASGGLPVAHIRTMDEVVARSTAGDKINTVLLSIFAGAALLLASIGIYGLMAYSVQQRTQELGIRMALGAQTGQLRNLVVFQGMRLALTGVMIGIAAAFGLTRFMASLLYAVKPWDPAVFTVVPITLCAVACLAIWLPARAATRIDPLEALRYE